MHLQGETGLKESCKGIGGEAVKGSWQKDQEGRHGLDVPGAAQCARFFSIEFWNPALVHVGLC